MENASERLKIIRKYFDYTQADFATKTDIPLFRIQNIENGRVKRFNTVEIEVLKELGFAEIWLKTGIGNMCEQRHEEPVLIPCFEKMTVSAGRGAEVWNEDADNAKEFPRAIFKNVRSFEALRCIKVSGYSMTPRYDDGDYVFVDTSHKKIDSEGVYVVSVDGMLLVKVLQWIPGGLRLLSYHSDYVPLDLTEATCPDSVHVIGKVVAAFTYA